MLKKKTVIWMTFILTLLSGLLIEYGEGITLMALVWMIPVLGIFTYLLMMQDWKENG